jgi:AsmA protein
MKTLFKIIAWVVGIIILLMIIAGIVLKYTFNPNDYKQQIISAVKHHTGRSLRIEGKIGLSVFPWLGVDVKHVALGNPAGFSNKTFAEVGDAQVKIQMFPMLFGDFRISKITLNDATINLTTLKNGHNNWSDFKSTSKRHTHTSQRTTTKRASAHKNAKSSSAPSGEFSIGNINIDNANVHIQNYKTGHNFNLSDFNLSGSGINFNGDSFSIKSSFNLSQTKPNIAFNTEASADITIGAGLVNVSDLSVSGKISTYKVALKTPVPYAFEADKIYTHDKNIQLKSLSVELANLKVNANLTVNDEHQVNGSFTIPNFNPSRLITALNLSNAYKNAAGLTSAQATIKVSTKGDVVSLYPFNITVDDSKINANASYNNLKKDLNFSLNINKINLNDYMAKSASSSSSTKAASKTHKATSNTTSHAPSVQIPRKMLQSINWNGTVHIGKLKSKDFILSDLNISTKNTAGDMTVSPISANLYKGTLSSSLELNANANPARLNTHFNITNVQLGPLVEALSHKQFITGTANFNNSLSSVGNTNTDMTLNLNGKGKLSIQKGDLKGFDLNSMIRQANDFLTHKKSGKPQAKKGKDTQFSSITGSYTINRGVINNNNLQLLTPYAQANGAGSVDLRNQTINYQLTAGPTAVNGHQAWNFPILITGPIAKPKIAPNMGAILGQVVKDAFGDLIKKALGGDSTTATKQDAKPASKNQQIQNLFNGLFHKK